MSQSEADTHTGCIGFQLLGNRLMTWSESRQMEERTQTVRQADRKTRDNGGIYETDRQ